MGSAVLAQRIQVIAATVVYSFGKRSGRFPFDVLSFPILTQISCFLSILPPEQGFHARESEFIRRLGEEFVGGGEMKDPRYTRLAQLLVEHSIKVQPGDKVL